MTLAFERPDTLSDIADLRALLSEYLDIVVETAHSDGAPPLDASVLLSATMDHLDDYVPPRGRTTLVRGADGVLQASVFVRMIRPDVAEMKRLYVRPALRQSGLGTRLTEQAMMDARGMGAREIYLDTLAAFGPARRMYERLGFRYIDPYPETENPPPMVPFTVCLAKTI